MSTMLSTRRSLHFYLYFIFFHWEDFCLTTEDVLEFFAVPLEFKISSIWPSSFIIFPINFFGIFF